MVDAKQPSSWSFGGHIWSDCTTEVLSQSCDPVQAGSVQPVVLCAASSLCLYTGTFVIKEYIRP